MGFFTRDVLQTLHDRLQTHFLSPSTMPKLSNVHSRHVVIIDDVVKLFDKSIWSLQDIVRVTELVMLPNYPIGKRKASNNHFQNRLGAAQLKPNFPLLRDFAQHTVHSSETLDVAIDTMAGIQSVYCHADDTPWMQLPPQPYRQKYAEYQNRQCKSWDKLMTWARQHNACYQNENIVDADGFPSEDAFEHFKYCPQGSPHSPLVEKFFRAESARC